MCILCVVQKWSRRVATMLPWLVIPLIGLWLLSQLLPPAFRFEITSPRLACVFVLLITLFWYEILMPQLSAWRARSNARLREIKRFEAIELQKLRKTATRRCRNCLTPYRDQNPGGGKFMCSYCGHLSKRPVLDLPVPSGLGMSNSGMFKDLVGNGEKLLNGKVRSDNAWTCGGQQWLNHGNRVGGSFVGNSSYWRYGAGTFSGENHCPATKSYSRSFLVACKSFTTFFLSIMWLFGKLFRINSAGIDSSPDVESTGALDKRYGNAGTCHLSKGDKARRKAEEKRQARLEKELMEEEERKQKEEVARLVEERRKLRGENIEAEKERVKGSTPLKGRDSKREAEKKRQERKKERDRLSSISNSDAEEFEKRASKDSDPCKRSEFDQRENLSANTENLRTHTAEAAYVSKASVINNSRGSSGARYLDRVRGTLLSSSRAFTGGGFFGKSASATVSREQKPNSLIEHGQTSASRRELSQPDRLLGRPTVVGDDRSMSHPVLIEHHPGSPPKKSWQQLFTRASSVSPPFNPNVISRPNGISKPEVQSPPLTSNSVSTQASDNPINFGLPSPFILSSLPLGSTNSNSFALLSEAKFPRVGEASRQYSPEECEIFVEPCYIPDPVSLLGPVSESLGIVADPRPGKAAALKDEPAPIELIRPSPIESPFSRLRVSEERHSNSFSFQSTPKSQEGYHQDGSSNLEETKTWQMWSSSPLVQDGLGLVGSTASWVLPTEANKPKTEDNLHTVPPKSMASLFKNDDSVFSGTHSPQKVFGGGVHNTGMCNIAIPGGSEVSWLPKTTPHGPVSEDHFSLKPEEEATRTTVKIGYNNPEVPVSKIWHKKDGNTKGSARGKPVMKPHIGGLYSTPDVQSLWSYG